MFDAAFGYAMGFEGWSAVSDDPDDPGGLTKYGISKVNHPEVDVANLTLEGAKAIYKKMYWNAIKGDQIAWKGGYQVLRHGCQHGNQARYQDGPGGTWRYGVQRSS